MPPHPKGTLGADATFMLSSLIRYGKVYCAPRDDAAKRLVSLGYATAHRNEKNAHYLLPTTLAFRFFPLFSA